ncbi:MAG: DUF4846 domain-containing protein [Bacteroidetes bacterium]|nr:DUF4846 domain-containing protein [Bacteroidota bacterium]
MTIKTRFNPPSDFYRILADTGSFAIYLRDLLLKRHGSLVTLYNNSQKPNDGVYAAVVDLNIGRKNLHQCADAVMRLRADYLWWNKRLDEIHFNFTNGFRVDYSKWLAGNKIRVNGNKTSWYKATEPDSSYDAYWKYLETIFTYAGTLSLEKELRSVEWKDMQIGDVLIQGGSPGHAVIVVDMVSNNSGEKQYLLAQSYMPAQQIQILLNPNNSDDNPWYSLNTKSDIIETPEWTFRKENLKRF